MKALRTHRNLILIHPVTPAHPAEIYVRYSDSGEERFFDVSLVIFESDEESLAALGKPLAELPEPTPKAYFVTRSRDPKDPLRTRQVLNAIKGPSTDPKVLNCYCQTFKGGAGNGVIFTTVEKANRAIKVHGGELSPIY